MTCYEIWTIVVSSLSALATFCAVIVALWQTKFANRKKIRLKTGTYIHLLHNMTTGQFNNIKYLVLKVSVINIGNRQVKLCDWGLEFSHKYGLQILNLQKQIFPFTLNIEEHQDLEAYFYDLKKALIANKDEISDYIKKKPKIYVTDSTGRKYYSKLPNTVEYYMNLPNEEIVLTD